MHFAGKVIKLNCSNKQGPSKKNRNLSIIKQSPDKNKLNLNTHSGPDEEGWSSAMEVNGGGNSGMEGFAEASEGFGNCWRRREGNMVIGGEQEGCCSGRRGRH